MKHTLTLHGVSRIIYPSFATAGFTSRADVDKPPFEVTETGYARSHVHLSLVFSAVGHV